eukprot:CAMPEP_0197828712 /NCGR_PEP_ID=MMETSP1437-20131217/5244_1 /TAXON_ID=49252 ORGANISM="Eucampia antarctica, Strain CCMP1452" /NCGR_SAMPLE_ID=MMETSP1437 /ASSEMBLY_ACC=CAM_ASM_001096 /LENGTH=73 /DNA_ID=CAMNT_0043430045 /DNA_START=155 /DNA_END=376 /DNA_ORIENTATION=-
MVRPTSNNQGPEVDFPKMSYTGKIRARKFIARLIYYNFNRWQIRNDIKHSTDNEITYKKQHEAKPHDDNRSVI